MEKEKIEYRTMEMLEFLKELSLLSQKYNFFFEDNSFEKVELLRDGVFVGKMTAFENGTGYGVVMDIRNDKFLEEEK